MPNLSKIRVVDFSRLLPGPYCTMLLADMGADVIKIESTVLGDPARLAPPFVGDISVTYAASNRNKRSLALNHRKGAGKQILVELLRTADVFIEVFKPGQAAKQGLDYAAVSAINPRIVYCSLSGYGQEGPYAKRSGHDLSFLALSGMLDMLRAPDGRPAIPGFQLADVAGGSMFATVAILAALLERSFTGKGQYLDVSIWEGCTHLMPLQLAPLVAGASQSEVAQDYLAGALPCYNVYETADGGYMALAALEPVLWNDFCKLVGREELIAYYVPDDADRAWAIGVVAAIFKSRTRSEWEAIFAQKDLCCEPVLSVEEVAHERLGQMGGGIVELAPMRQMRAPEALSDPGILVRPAPLLGQHTAEVLAELGYSPEQIDALRQDKIAATPQDITIHRLKSVPLA